VDAPAAQLEEGCRAEVGYACYLRGQQLKEAFWDSLSPESQEETIRDGLRKAIREAHPWFERACARDIQEGCFEEAWVLMHGPKAERAVTLLENACRDWRGRHNRVVDSALSCIWLAKAYEEGLGVARDWQRARTMLHEVCQLDQVCNDLYLVDSSNRRRWIWSLEYSAAMAANGFALFLLRRHRPAAKWHFPLLLTIALLAGLSIAWELWYYFTGSRWQSPLWWAVAVVPALFPLFAWRRTCAGVE
jgi:hypothetical protein